MNRQSGNTIASKNIAGLIIIFIVYGIAEASNEFRTLFLSSQGLTATEIGRVFAATSLLTVFAGPIASAMADKFRSRRKVYLLSASLWMILIAVLILTRQYRIAGFALCAGIMPLVNISQSVTYNMIEASGVNASILVPKLDFSFIRVALSISYCLINFAYTPLARRFGPEIPFVCTGAMAVALLILSGTLKTFETEQNASASEKKKLDVGRLLKNYFLVTFLLLGIINAMGGSTGSYLLYLMKDIGMDTSLVGTASGIRVAGEIVLMLSLTLLRKKVSIPMFQAVAVFLTLAQAVIYITVREPVIIMAALALGGAASGITLGTRAVYLRALAPDGLDTLTITLYSSTFAAGNMIMNLLGGIIIDKSGIIALYKVSAIIIASWLFLYFATWIFGKYVLKKEPPMPMLRPYR